MINPLLLATLILNLQVTPLHIDSIKVDTVNQGHATIISLDVSGCKPLTKYVVAGKRNTRPDVWIAEACFTTTTNQTTARVSFIYSSNYNVTSAMYRIQQVTY